MMARIRLQRCPQCHQRLRRSNPQNARYWLLLHRLSEKLLKGRFSPDSWHVYLKSRYLGCEDMRLPNGKTIPMPRSTAALDVAEFSTYMDQCEAWAAEHEVYLDEVESAG